MASLASIIIPVKDRRDLLRETLQSLAAQTYPHWEAVVIDDGSTDGTLELLAQWSTSDARVRWQQRIGERAGAQVCRNQGFAASTGEFVIFLDSDDLLAPHCLQQRVPAIEGRLELDFAVFPCEIFRRQPGDVGLLWNAHTSEDDLQRLLRLDVPWQTAGPIWRREALVRMGPWDEQLPSWQDWEFHVRSLALGMKYAKFPGPDCHWRMPAARRSSIGEKSHSPPHLTSHGNLMRRVAEMLRQRGLLTEARRRALSGVCFSIARLWLRIGQRQQALQIWSAARGDGLIDEKTYRTGWAFLLTGGGPIGWRVLQLFNAAGWPAPEWVERQKPFMWRTPRAQWEIHPDRSLQGRSLLLIDPTACGDESEVLLVLLRWLTHRADLGLRVLVLSKGSLRSRFSELAPTRAVERPIRIPGLRMASRMISRSLFRPFPKQPDLIYCNTVAGGEGLTRARRSDEPVVTHVHVPIDPARLPKGAEQSLQCSSAYVAGSTEAGQSLIQCAGVEPGQVTVAEVFIDAAEWVGADVADFRQRLRAELSLPMDACVVGCFGSGRGLQRAQLFFSVAQRLAEAPPERLLAMVWFECYDSSDYEPEARRLREASAAKPICRLLPKSHSLIDSLGGCDLLVLPSTDDPLPVLFLKAAALGVPTVCAGAAGSIAKFVALGGGAVVPEIDPQKVADKLQEALASPELRAEWGRHARRAVVERHDVNVQAPRIFQVIKKTLLETPTGNSFAADFLGRVGGV